MTPKLSNPIEAAKEDLSVGYITQLAADSGAAFQEHRKDFIGVDGQVDFLEAPLRVQLKSTTQVQYWKPSFDYYLKQEWLEKWRGSLSPTVLVLLVIKERQKSNGQRKPWLSHNPDDYLLPARGYWMRVDEIAKAHDLSVSKGLSITLDNSHRINEQTITEWHKVALSLFQEGSAK